MRLLRAASGALPRRSALAVMVAALLLLAAGSAGAALLPRDTTARVSVTSAGAQATDGFCARPSTSADGRYIAFYSVATDVIANDTNGVGDVFVHDKQTGVTERVSVATGGGQATGNSENPAISADGRHVTFHSSATDLIGSDTNGAIDVFVHDRVTGTTERVSIATGGDSKDPSISGDGRYVAFESAASDLVPSDTNGVDDVFVYDRLTDTAERVSRTTGGAQVSGGDSGRAFISHDGRHVAFESFATDVVAGDTNGYADVFLHDRESGATTRVSVTSDGAQATGGSSAPWSLSADGRFVGLSSKSSSLVPGDTNGNEDAFVHDTRTGTTQRVSVASGGGQGVGGISGFTNVSADGRYVTFYSSATNLVAGDTNGSLDIFVRDLLMDATERVNTAPDGSQSSGGNNPHLSADGRSIVFASIASDLVSGDTNGFYDVFLKNLLPADATSVPVEGATRYETAVAASEEAFPMGADTVVIATGANWPDALGGAALAGALNGPILLTRAAVLPPSVLNEIGRLGATEAVILGGEGAVSGTVEQALKDELGDANVTRYGGANRYATADLIAEAVADELGVHYDGTCFVTTGSNFPDALAGSPLAAAKGWPIFLAPKSGLAASSVAAMAQISVDEALILGGTGVVSSEIETALETEYGVDNVKRLGGATRYETAVDVATYGVDEAWMRWDGVALATGQNFPDALAGGVLQGRLGSVMLLSHSSSLTAVTSDALGENKESIGEVHFLGGSGALSADMRSAAEQALQ